MDISNTSSVCYETFRTSEFSYVGIARAVSASVAFLMCSGALLLILVLKRWQFFSEKLIIYLLTAAALASVGALISVNFNYRESDVLNQFCMFSAFVLQATTWMLNNSISAVTVYLFILIVLDYNTDKYKWLYVFGIFFIPLLVNWIPFVRSAYGTSGVWCWIRSIDEKTCETFIFGYYLQIILFYAPIHLFLIIDTILYLIILVDITRKLRKPAWVNGLEMQSRLKDIKREFLSLSAYPFIFLVLNIPLTINRVYFLLHPEKPKLVLWYLSALFAPFQGIVTAITFTMLIKPWKAYSCKRIRAVYKRGHTVVEYPLIEATTDSMNLQDHEYHHFQSNNS